MIENNFHNKNINQLSPPPATLPIIQKLTAAYKLWHEFLPHIAKAERFTLGTKLDSLFVQIIELVFTASCLNKQQKLPYLQRSVIKLDTLKFFLQLAWETKALDGKKYILLSEKLFEIGRMLGGWNRQIAKENLAK